MTRHALVVDDSMLIRHTVCRFLEERGFEVQSASNGAEALQVMKEFTPEIIVTDLLMPKMTGPELIGALKDNPETAAIPIVVLSGRTSSAHVCPERRADFVIYKDIDIENQLGAALNSALANVVAK